MMRSLLEERFKLRVHRETRQLDGYALVRISNDRLGPSIQASTLNCRDPKAVRPQGGRFSCGMTFGPGSFIAGDIRRSASRSLGVCGYALSSTRLGISEPSTGVEWAPVVSLRFAAIFTACRSNGAEVVSEPVPAEVVASITSSGRLKTREFKRLTPKIKQDANVFVRAQSILDP